ncbi:uncharacterized protein LOC144244921 [Crocuta crocuta]
MASTPRPRGPTLAAFQAPNLEAPEGCCRPEVLAARAPQTWGNKSQEPGLRVTNIVMSPSKQLHTLWFICGLSSHKWRLDKTHQDVLLVFSFFPRECKLKRFSSYICISILGKRVSRSCSLSLKVIFEVSPGAGCAMRQSLFIYV